MITYVDELCDRVRIEHECQTDAAPDRRGARGGEMGIDEVVEVEPDGTVTVLQLVTP